MPSGFRPYDFSKCFRSDPGKSGRFFKPSNDVASGMSCGHNHNHSHSHRRSHTAGGGKQGECQ